MSYPLSWRNRMQQPNPHPPRPEYPGFKSRLWEWPHYIDTDAYFIKLTYHVYCVYRTHLIKRKQTNNKPSVFLDSREVHIQLEFKMSTEENKSGNFSFKRSINLIAALLLDVNFVYEELPFPLPFPRCLSLHHRDLGCRLTSTDMGNSLTFSWLH